MFVKWWPDFEAKLTKLPTVPAAAVVPHRTERDLLEELLARVKGVRDAGPSQNPNLTRTDIAAVRVQLLAKIAEVEVKRVEMMREGNHSGLYDLQRIVQDLKTELYRL